MDIDPDRLFSGIDRAIKRKRSRLAEQDVIKQQQAEYDRKEAVKRRAQLVLSAILKLEKMDFPDDRLILGLGEETCLFFMGAEGFIEGCSFAVDIDGNAYSTDSHYNMDYHKYKCIDGFSDGSDIYLGDRCEKMISQFIRSK